MYLGLETYLTKIHVSFEEISGQQLPIKSPENIQLVSQ